MERLLVIKAGRIRLFVNLYGKHSSASFITCRKLSESIFTKNLDLNVKLEIEEYWKDKLGEQKYDAKSSKPKFYVLSMFPYPSGNLHMGHVRVYTISDTIARFHRLKGKNVFQPMGWDAFGLPAENAAFEHGKNPKEWTESNIKQMKSQLQKLRCTFDWDCEISTCSSDYYRWTQFIFLKLYENGLVCRKKAEVNWDPVNKTVLADEQVDDEGRSWRSGALVEKIVLNQWFIKTTNFAEQLYKSLSDNSLENWKDIIDIQKHWIGKCDGYSFDLKIVNNGVEEENSLNVWTESGENMINAQYIVVSQNNFLNEFDSQSEYFLKSVAINPFTKKELPIYVSNNVQYPSERNVYVAIPSIRECDKEFAKSVGIDVSNEVISVTGDICKLARESGFGGYAVNSKLKDWLISRQRYWGTPIPIIICDGCGAQPVPYDQLPVTLPEIPSDCNISSNRDDVYTNWINTNCPKCGKVSKRETDTMDTFLDSSWYYLRYIDANNTKEPFNVDKANSLMPVDVYVGGKEHAVLHLYYARFMNHFLHSIGLVKHLEPFTRLLVQGMIMGKTYRTANGLYVKPEEIREEDEKAFLKETDEEVSTSWEKMSKSKYNGVEPDEVLNEYGTDTTRLIVLFNVAPQSQRNWSSDLFYPVVKWQNRLWSLIREFIKVRNNPLFGAQPWVNMQQDEDKLKERRSNYVRGTTYHYLNTQQLAAAFTKLQEMTNILQSSSRQVKKFSKQYERLLASQIIMLAPMAPHFAATLWLGFVSAEGRLNVEDGEINWDGNVFEQKWPIVDSDYKIFLVLQLNNAAVYRIPITKDKLEKLTEEDAVKLAVRKEKIERTIAKYGLVSAKYNIVSDTSYVVNITTNQPWKNEPLTKDKQEVADV